MIFPVAIYTEYKSLVYSLWSDKEKIVTQVGVIFAPTKSIGETFLIGGKFVIAPDSVPLLNENLPFALKSFSKKLEKELSRPKQILIFFCFKSFSCVY